MMRRYETEDGRLCVPMKATQSGASGNRSRKWHVVRYVPLRGAVTFCGASGKGEVSMDEALPMGQVAEDHRCRSPKCEEMYSKDPVATQTAPTSSANNPGPSLGSELSRLADATERIAALLEQIVSPPEMNESVATTQQPVGDKR